MLDKLSPEALGSRARLAARGCPLLGRGLSGKRRQPVSHELQVRQVDWPARGARTPALVEPSAVGELRGRAHIIDVDTIVIKRTKIRLAGIDASELDQPFGQKSKWAMVALCKGQVITAKLNGETSHDRLVGTCYLPDGRDIGAELVKQGLALDWTYHSGGKYRGLEPPGIRRKLHNKTAWR